MKPYKSFRLKEATNSISELDDPKLVDELVTFIKDNPFPKDHEQFHTYFEGKGYDVDKVEQYAYAMLTLILCGGKSKGKDSGADKENMDIGHKIEVEHCEYPEVESNEVIKRMIEVLVHKISSDHTTESKTYYVDGVNFLDELKRENK